MRKRIKRGLAVLLGLVFGLAGILSINDGYLYNTTVISAAVLESVDKSGVRGPDILDYEQFPDAKNYVINNIAGMEKLAELVNNGTSFRLKAIWLNADLKYDKAIENNHEIIGNFEHEFDGMFIGNFHTISGINLNSDSRCVGLFGCTGDYNVKISNIILEDSKIIAKGGNTSSGCAGGIAGVNNGGIGRCVIGKNVEIIGSVNVDVGGIVGENNEYMFGCINYSSIKGDGRSAVGGIVGTMSSSEYTHVWHCVNYGSVHVESNSNIGSTRIGGICGGGGRIHECCNMGPVVSEAVVIGVPEGIGGIAGTGAKIINCYNAGQVIAESDDLYSSDEARRRFGGGISGGTGGPIQNSYSVGEVKNGWSGAVASVYADNVWKLSMCYWLTGTADVGVCESGRGSWTDKVQDLSSVFECSQSKMRSQEFVRELNVNSVNLDLSREKEWAEDTKNRNNGYPVLRNVAYTVEELIQESLDEDLDDDEDLDTTEVEHFYEDYSYDNHATNSTIRIYANGGTVTIPGTAEKRNYKSCTLYTDITASYNYTVDKKGKVKPSTGKVIVGITLSDMKPVLVKGKIVDRDAAKIASASIKSGQITVTAKTQPGKAYLWAMDTGRAAEAACIPITVKAAPTAAEIYAISDTDPSFTYGAAKQFKSGKVNVGESIKVYLYPTYKQNGTVQKAKNVRYTAAVDAKSSDYFAVSQSADDPLCFEVSAKGLKDGKSVSGRITFTCGLNGRKTVFTAAATNQVTDISEGNVSGLTKTADHCFRITASDAAKTTGTFEMQTECVSSAYAATDNLKLYAMGSADGYDAAGLAEGTVKITKKKSAAQGKISMKLERDKKTITVTAAKGTKPVTAYYLAVYNTVNSGAKKGYAVLSVTAE